MHTFWKDVHDRSNKSNSNGNNCNSVKDEAHGDKCYERIAGGDR